MHHTMYHCSTRSSKCYHSVKVSVSYPDWAIRSSRQGIKHIPTYWFRTGYLYIFLNPRLKRTGAWNTEDWVGGEHYFAVHFFARFAFFSSYVYYSLPFPSFSFSFTWPLVFLKCRVGLRNFHFNMVQCQALDWLLQRPKEFRTFYSDSQQNIVLWSHCLINENPKANEGISAGAWLTFSDSFLFWFLQKPQSLNHVPFLEMKNCRWPESFVDTEKENSTESCSVPFRSQLHAVLIICQSTDRYVSISDRDHSKKMLFIFKSYCRCSFQSLF